jgi:hypothetical protein
MLNKGVNKIMATYKATLIIKEEEKKLHIALAEDTEAFVKVITGLNYPETDINTAISNAIAAYPADLEAFEAEQKQKTKKTSPVAVNTETTKKIAEESRTAEKPKTDLFQAAEKAENETSEEPSVEVAAEETTASEENNADSELFE